MAVRQSYGGIPMLVTELHMLHVTGSNKRRVLLLLPTESVGSYVYGVRNCCFRWMNQRWVQRMAQGCACSRWHQADAAQHGSHFVARAALQGQSCLGSSTGGF